MVEQYPEARKLPDEVFSAVYDAAHEENHLRDRGYTQKRIGSLVGKKLSRELINLQLKGIDTRHAFPPEESSETPPEKEMTDEEEIKVERLMDTTGMGYDEALQRIRARSKDS